MLIKTYAAALQGIDSTLITVEVNCTSGCDFMLVGLPDNAVRESHERIQSAITINGYKVPMRTQIINMAPADIKKEGAAFDLPLCIGMLAADEQLSTMLLDKYIIMGELSLDGTLQPIKGALSMALMAKYKDFKGIILPHQNAKEAAIVDGIDVIGAHHLMDVLGFLEGKTIIEPQRVDVNSLFDKLNKYADLDYADVKGQDNVKRAVEIAAAGGHNMIMVGPPGAGKSMIAKRLPSILPPMNMSEALETTKIHSVAGTLGKDQSLMTERPFRSPHHTITDVALVGGGTNPQPGEISLANNGVLFLDELPEFKRSALEVLRQPLEDRHISVSRARMHVDYPASFMLVASMNPCPCGNYNNPLKPCTCTPTAVHKYLRKISGPLMDRIDLQVEIAPVSFEDMQNDTRQQEHSETIRERVIRARIIQSERFAGTSTYCNAQMTSKQIRQYCVLDDECLNLIRLAMDKMGLSARAYDKILKVSRTIADLEGATNIGFLHLSEAIGYRNLDKSAWGE